MIKNVVSFRKTPVSWKRSCVRLGNSAETHMVHNVFDKVFIIWKLQLWILLSIHLYTGSKAFPKSSFCWHLLTKRLSRGWLLYESRNQKIITWMTIIRVTESKDYHVDDCYTSNRIKIITWMTIIRVTESKDYHVDDYYKSNRIERLSREWLLYQ